MAGGVFGDVDLQLWEVAGARNAILHEIRRSGGKSKLCDWMGSVSGFHAQIMIGSAAYGDVSCHLLSHLISIVSIVFWI